MLARKPLKTVVGATAILPVGFATAILLSSCATGLAATIRVPQDQPTIQDGIDSAASGDTVLVAPGQYSQNQIRTIGEVTYRAVAFLESGVLVRSEKGPAATTMDLLGVLGPTSAVVVAAGMASGEASLEGFTLTGAPPNRPGVEIDGNSPGSVVRIADCALTNLDGGLSRPAGIYCHETSLSLIGSEFKWNGASNRNSGLLFEGSAVESLAVRDVTFHLLEGIVIQAEGAASVTIVDSTFRQIFAPRGAVTIDAALVRVERCFFDLSVGNESLDAAAVRVSGVSDPTSGLNECVFTGNSVNGAGANSIVTVATPNFAVTNCTFHGNSVGTPDGASVTLRCDEAGTYSVERNLFTGSTGSSPAVRRIGSAGSATLSCNGFWSNQGPDAVGIKVDSTNRHVDPVYCFALSGDLSLNSTSPYLSENSPGCGLVGAFGAGCTLVDHVVTTFPLMPQVHVDGLLRVPPTIAWWPSGSTHVIVADSVQVVGSDRYAFVQWEDGSTNATRSLLAPEKPTTFTATFAPSPLYTVLVETPPVAGVRIKVDGSTRYTPHQFTAPEGDVIDLVVPKTHFLSEIDRYVFTQWDDGSVDTARTVVIPASNVEYSATYTADPFVSLRIESAPTNGWTVLVNGQGFNTPRVEYADSGAVFQLFVPSPQTRATGIATFREWEDGSTNPTRTVALGDSSRTIVANFDIDSETSATLLTQPSGHRVLVDGVEFSSPVSLIWEMNSRHTIAAPEFIQEGDEKSRLRFGSWNNGGPREKVVTATPQNQKFVANFVTQHLVEALAGPGGSVSPPSDWYDQGASATLTAAAGDQFVFAEWTGVGGGSYTGPDNPITLLVSNPMQQLAEFAPNRFEFSMSSSATDANQNSGLPLGVGSIYLWVVCESDRGISRAELEFQASGLDVLAFVPAPGVVNSGTATSLLLDSADCFPTSGVVGSFVVADPDGGRLCPLFAPGPGEPGLRLDDCGGLDEVEYVGPEFIRVRGFRSDSGPPCEIGLGCSSPPVATLVNSLRGTPREDQVLLEWTTSDEGEAVTFSVERSSDPSGPFVVRARFDSKDQGEAQFLDGDVVPSSVYYYRVEGRRGPRVEWKGPIEVATPATEPEVTTLGSASPNPFREKIEVRFTLKRPAPMRMTIYDVAGRSIRSFVERTEPAGPNSVTWDGRDDRGRSVESGIYFLRWTADGVTETRRLVRLD